MSITCGCSGTEYAWYFDPPTKYTTMDASKRKRCMSCNDLIDKGATCTKMRRWREPNSDIEEEIKGCEVPLAPGYMCEECSDLFFSLEEMGYCISLSGIPIKEEWRDLLFYQK